MNRLDSPNLLCPSARMKEGATLLGIVMPDGRVAFAADRLIVNREFISNAQVGRPPEKRFRFAGTCVRTGCAQWTGQRCGVIDEVLGDVPASSSQPHVPECSIRPQCRWYNQAGADACHVCSLVITDSRQTTDQGAASLE